MTLEKKIFGAASQIHEWRADYLRYKYMYCIKVN